MDMCLSIAPFFVWFEARLRPLRAKSKATTEVSYADYCYTPAFSLKHAYKFLVIS